MKNVNCYRPAAQRLLALGITASTLQLVRALQNGGGATDLRGLMSERRRLLRELETGCDDPDFMTQLAALRAAVEESDRTVEGLPA